MNYSPVLKKAMQEIKEILIKNEITGIVALHTPGYGEHLMHLTAPYSMVKLDGRGEIHLVSKHIIGPNKKAQAVKDTANQFAILADIIGTMAMATIQISEIIDKEVNANHDKGNNSSHQTQNN